MKEKGKLTVEQRDAIKSLTEMMNESDAAIKKLTENNEKLLASKKELNCMQRESISIDDKIAALEQQLSQEIANLALLKANGSNL